MGHGDEKDPDPEQPLDSEALFGDLVDAPAPADAARSRGGAPRKGPIKVRLGDAAREAGQAPLPADMAKLLDAIPGGDAVAAEPAADLASAAAAAMAEGPAEAAPLPKSPEAPPAARASPPSEAAPAVAAPTESAPSLPGPERPEAVEPITPTEPSPAPPLPGRLQAEGFTPTPAVVEPLPDVEYRESQQLSADAEAMTDLMQLTSRLPRESVLDTAPSVDLASVAEDALDAAAAEGPDVVLRLPPEPNADGLHYGPYTLLEKIAVGGMAEVFRAKRTGVAGFEKVVAVKRILPHLSYNREFVEMFIDEAKMVAGLAHPNIVQIFDLGRIGSSYYIAMEYVHGVDLRSTLKRLRERGLRMPADVAVYLASKVCAALEAAHSKHDAEGRPLRIVHRDVSPQNILISYEGEVKLTDFGIAKATTKASRTEKGALRGKLMYMSPEQAWGKPMDHRSDIYSLGIVLYEMLTDERPFLGSTDMSLLEKVRRGSIVPPSTLQAQIPEALERVVMRALRKDPEERFRDAGAMHQELEALLKEHVVTSKEVARFLRILFDPKEREGRDEELLAGPAPDLEVDLGPPEPSAPEPSASGTPTEEAETPVPRDPLSLERLLRRFGQP